MTMRTIALGFATMLMISGCAAMDEGPTSAKSETIVTRTATVETVDLETRQVLLRTDDKEMLSIVAGPDVRNLGQLEAGDVVRYQYYEAVAARMAQVGDPGGAVESSVAGRAPEGVKPGAVTGDIVEMVVEFVSYDPVTAIATFITPDGVIQNAIVDPELREFAAARQSGDQINLTITQAVAVAIDPTGT